MDKNLADIKKMLIEGNYTCVVLDKNNNIITSNETGIRPLINLVLNDACRLRDSCVADRIIGAAAAAILIESGVKECYGYLMSETAISLLCKSNVKYSYHKKTSTILNRDKTDICPMEKMSGGLDSLTAYNVLLDFFKNLNSSNRI